MAGLTHGCPVRVSPQRRRVFGHAHSPIIVTPGLVPGVHVLFGGKKNVDARDKHGHDDSLESSLFGGTTHFAEPDSRGLDPAIHVLVGDAMTTWMPGTSPGMTR